MSYQQAKNGPLTLFTDVIYADVASGGSFVTSRTFSPHVAGTLGGTLSADYKYWIIEAGGTYEIASWNSHGGRYATPDTELELLAGGRYWHQELDIAVALRRHRQRRRADRIGRPRLAHSGAHEWVDPFVGARIRFQPAPGEEIVVRGDIGGFGRGKQVHLAGARHLQLAGLHARADADRRLRRLARAAGRLRDTARASSATSSTCSSRARSWASPAGLNSGRLTYLQLARPEPRRASACRA